MRLLLLVLLSYSTLAVDVYDKKGRLTKEYLSIDYSKGEAPSDGIFTLPDGKVFKYVSFLGEGNNSNVIRAKAEDGNEYALRLPKLNNDFLEITQEYYEILERYNVSIPKRYNDSNQYLVQEIVPHKFDLAFFLYHVDDETFYNYDYVKKALQALFRFADDMGRFEFIGDFDDTQLVYNQIDDKWVLLDWTNEAAVFYNGSEEFIFDDPNFFRKNSREDLSGKAISILINLKQRAFYLREKLLKEDKIAFEKMDQPRSKEELIKLLTYPWNSADYKYAHVFSKYIVNHKSIFQDLDFSNDEINRSIRFYNFLNDDGYYLFRQQLRLSKDADEFISVVTETDYIHKFLKAHLLYEELDILMLQSPSLDSARSLIMYLDKEMNEKTRMRLENYIKTKQNCFSKLSSFKD